MVKIPIELSCGLCSERVKVAISAPDGWAAPYDAIDYEDALCPKHSIIKQWRDAQCPGCVGGWGDCDLFRSFAYSNRRELSDGDFAQIQKGVCPKRTNGTFGASRSRSSVDIDLSDRAPVEAGEALANAIRDYWRAYPERGVG